ncbi:MAG: M15 family metallopeptidase [Treponema sp.]|jgi:hypothetical protein|nr:M15 family metallopeptidase [Treponema sp.]
MLPPARFLLQTLRTALVPLILSAAAFSAAVLPAEDAGDEAAFGNTAVSGGTAASGDAAAISAAPARFLPDGETVLRAYRHTYPERVGTVEYKNGDWTIRAGSETFYWAGGRLLPEELRGEAEKWRPHSFGVYLAAVPPPAAYSPDYIESLRAMGNAGAEDRALAPEDRHRGFEAALYGGSRRAEIEKHLEPVSFLGYRIVAHRDIVEALRRVEAAIRGAAERERAGKSPAAGSGKDGGSLEQFLDDIGQVGAYNWRAIRGSRRMSYHSWGLAVDILPKKQDHRAIYWLWERARNGDWMLVPPEARWNPPAAVIRAFENEGFIWGGKWALYDNMHFEYRPELHEINRILASKNGAGERSGVSTAEGPDLHHLYPKGLGKAGSKPDRRGGARRGPL